VKRVIAGLDLGCAQDYSAFVVADVSPIPDLMTYVPPGEPTPEVNRFDFRHLWRWPLGTKYTEIVSDLKRWFVMTPQWQSSTLVVDGTGVGRAVVDMIGESQLPCEVKPFSITAGKEPNLSTEDGKMPTVPKKDLVGAVAVCLESRRLRFAPSLDLTEVVQKELENFRVTVDEVTRNETFGAGREGKNDDLVLAVSLVCWHGEQTGCGDHGVIVPSAAEQAAFGKYRR